MKLAAVLLLLICLLSFMIGTFGMSALSGFALWMGGFLTSEAVCWIVKSQFPLKETSETNRYKVTRV